MSISPKRVTEQSFKAKPLEGSNFQKELKIIIDAPLARQKILQRPSPLSMATDPPIGFKSDTTYAIKNLSINELSKSWYYVNQGLHKLFTTQSEKQRKPGNSATDKGVSDYLTDNHSFLISSSFTSHFYGAATLHKFRNRQRRIRLSLAALRARPPSAQNPALMMEIESKSLELEELHHTLIVHAGFRSGLEPSTHNKSVTPNIDFTGQIPEPQALIMAHAQLINSALKNREIPPSDSSIRANTEHHYKHLWKNALPGLPYLIQPKSVFGPRQSESWLNYTKKLEKELAQLATRAKEIKKTTPRGVSYAKEGESRATHREEVISLALLIRLRIALLDFSQRFEQFNALKSQATLQATLTQINNGIDHADNHPAVLNQMRLHTLELQTHLAYGQLFASLIRLNASTSDGYIETKQFITASLKPFAKELFVSANIIHAHNSETALTDHPSSNKVSRTTVTSPAKILPVQRSANTNHMRAIMENHTFGIRLLYAKNHTEFAAHRMYSGLRDLPYRTQLKGFDTHYSIYYATYPSKHTAEQALQNIPPFYQLFKPVIKPIPN
ncbi:MAG: hypothetical protein KUG83_10105 [Gammaproteobacteria bacterium]|nr:hypothetical protein [Gammaproteobacteria bacterium]